MEWAILILKVKRKTLQARTLISGCRYFNSIFISKIVDISQHLFYNKNLHLRDVNFKTILIDHVTIRKDICASTEGFYETLHCTGS